jgi:hypothetical protein
VGIVCVAAFFCVLHLGRRSFWLDEAASVAFARMDTSLGDVRERGSGLPWAWFFNVLLPLNDDGVRSAHIFAVGAEVVF